MTTLAISVSFPNSFFCLSWFIITSPAIEAAGSFVQVMQSLGSLVFKTYKQTRNKSRKLPRPYVLYVLLLCSTCVKYLKNTHSNVKPFLTFLR